MVVVRLPKCVLAFTQSEFNQLLRSNPDLWERAVNAGSGSKESGVKDVARQAVVRKLPPYRGERYWEKEKPIEAQTDRVALAYYPKAGKLQISALWPDRGTGEKRRGKTVTLDQEDMALHPEALKLLVRALEEWG